MAGNACAAYIVQLLHRLGYRASRKSFPYPASSDAFSGPRRSMQIAFTDWVADYPSAGAFLRPSLSCQGNANDAGFCDPKT